MSRDGSGNYTLPAGNPVVTGTVIATTWANPTLSDVAQALTDSLDRSGRGAMLAALRLIDGTAGTPSLAFSSNTNMGLYRVAAGTLGVSTGGVLRLSINATGNAVVAPPSAGAALTVNGLAGAVTMALAQAGNECILTLDSTGGSGRMYAIRSNASGDFVIRDVTAVTTRLTIAPSGAVTISAPSSGTPLTVNNSTTSASIYTPGSPTNHAAALLANGSTTGAVWIQLDNTSGSSMVGTESSAGGTLLAGAAAYSTFLKSNNNPLYLATNNAVRLTVAADGLVAVSVPTGVGAALTVNAQAGQLAAEFACINNEAIITLNSIGGSGRRYALRSNSATGHFVIRDVTAVTDRLVIQADGRLYGTALHNVGTVTGTTTQYIASGTYTVTATNVANATTLATGLGQWIRVGNVVTVSGTFSMAQTSATTQTQVSISIPIASTLSATSDCNGSAWRRDGTVAASGGTINVSAGVPLLNYLCDGTTSSRTWVFNMQYTVL